MSEGDEYVEEIFESVGDEDGKNQGIQHVEDEEELPEVSQFKEQISKIPSRYPEKPYPKRHESSFTISAKNEDNFDVRYSPSNKNNISDIGSSYHEASNSNNSENEGKKKDSFDVKLEESIKNFLDPANETNMAYSEVCDSNLLKSSLKLKIQQQMQEQHQSMAGSMNISKRRLVDSLKIDSTSNLSKSSAKNKSNEKEGSVISYNSNISYEGHNSLSYSVSRNPSALPHSRISNRLSSNHGNTEKFISPKSTLDGFAIPNSLISPPPQLVANKISFPNAQSSKGDTQNIKGDSALKRPQLKKIEKSGTKKPTSDSKPGAEPKEKVITDKKPVSNVIKVNRPNSATARPVSNAVKKSEDEKLTKPEANSKNQEKNKSEPVVNKSLGNKANGEEGSNANGGENKNAISGGKKAGGGSSKVNSGRGGNNPNIRISKPNSEKINPSGGKAVSKENYMDFLKKKLDSLKQNPEAKNTENILGDAGLNDSNSNLFQEEEIAQGDQALPEMRKPSEEEDENLNVMDKHDEEADKKQDGEGEDSGIPAGKDEGEDKKNKSLKSAVEKIQNKNKGDLHKVFVKKINANYKEKMKKLQEKEDDLFVKEELEKKKVQPKKEKADDPQLVKKEKDWVVRPLSATTTFGKAQPVAKNNKENLKEAAKKIGKKVEDESQPEKPIQENENEKPQVQEAEPDVKEASLKSQTAKKGWNYPVGEGVEPESQKTQRLHDKELKKKENDYNISEKKSKMSKAKEDLALLKKMREKEKEYAKEREANQIKGNKTLQKVNNLLKDPSASKNEVSANVQSEENLREKQAQNSQIINTLKVEMRQMMLQNNSIDKTIAEVKKKKEEVSAKVNELKKNKAIIELPGNKFITFGQVPTISSGPKNLSDTADTLNDKNSANQSLNVSSIPNISEEVTAVETFISQIAAEGLSLQDVFHLLDKDGDEILTITEIRDNIHRLNLTLKQVEIEEFLNVLDKNSDGIISQDEFINSLESVLATQKDYNAIMGELKGITNPIILEERRLDLSVRKNVVEKLLKSEEKEELLIKVEFNLLKEELDGLETRFKKMANRNRLPMAEIKKELEMISLEVARLEGEKRTLQNKQKDLITEITENINSLTGDLSKRSELILIAKDSLYKETNELEKLRIKMISYNKFIDKLEENLKERNLNETKLAKNIQDNMAIKNLISKKKGKDVLVLSVIKIQRIFRGFLSRKCTTTIKHKKLGAKAVIVYHLRAFKKRINSKRGGGLSQMLENLVRRHVHEEGFRKIRDRSKRVQRQRDEIKKQKDREEQRRRRELEAKEALERERLEVIEESARIEQAKMKSQEIITIPSSQNILEEEEVRGADQALNIPKSPLKKPPKKQEAPKQDKSLKVDIPVDNKLNAPSKPSNPKISMDRELSSSPLAKNLIIQLSPQVLAASLTIQRNYRSWRRFKPKIFRTYFGSISEICPVCNTENVEKICRKCKNPCFCRKCFKKMHGGDRKNHRFFNLDLEENEDIDYGDNIEEQMELIKRIFDKNRFNLLRYKLDQEEDHDMYILEQNAFGKVLRQTKLDLTNSEIELIEKVVEKKFKLTRKELLTKLEEKNKKDNFDKTKNYIDLFEFLMFISDENKTENDT